MTHTPNGEREAAEVLNEAYWQGWRNCSEWAKRDDLLADRDSYAYTVERDRAIALLQSPAAVQQGEAVESKLAAAGVFKGAHGLRGLADAQEFWDRQPYGTRLYYGDGGADYLHRSILRTAVELLAAPTPSPASPEVGGLVDAALYSEIKRQAAYRGFDCFADMALAYDKLAALAPSRQAGGEAVAEVVGGNPLMPDGKGLRWADDDFCANHPIGTKLYTHPAPSAESADSILDIVARHVDRETYIAIVRERYDRLAAAPTATDEALTTAACFVDCDCRGYCKAGLPAAPTATDEGEAS